MKRNIIRTMAAAAGILLLTACSNEVGIVTDVDAGSITIQATIGHMTKVAYPSSNSTIFVADDTILVYGWIGSNTEIPAKRVVDSVPNVYNGTVWTPLKPMLWKNTTDAHYFLGIYPEPKSVTSLTEAEFTLDPANYKASDLLIATNLTGVKATDGPVNLTFEHVMAKLNVNLKFRNEFGGTPDVSSVTAGAYSSAKINYLTKEVTTFGTAGEVIIPKATEPAQGFEMSFTGLQIPQNDVNRISITIGNRVFVYTSAQEIPLEGGKYTTLNLIVGKDQIELDGISVKDWAAGTNLPDAEAVLQNVHAYVDMGNGLKWATCNVGASKPDDYGDYFAWGETATKDNYYWNTYAWGDGTTFTKYNVGGTTILEAKDDAATANWGGNWRTPTDAEWTWLRNINNCDWTWKTTADGYAHNGMLVTSKINGNQIFLPAAGCRDDSNLFDEGSYGWFWSSSLNENDSDYARSVYFSSEGVGRYNDDRYFGQSVRPVTE